jgi:tetratricopeptide (TPR) repeat protein
MCPHPLGQTVINFGNRVPLARMMRLFGVLLVLLTYVLAPVSQGQKPSTDEIAAALRAREFDRAVQLSRSALQKFPGDARLWTLQGIALANLRKDKEALAAFQRALKLSPDAVAALAGAAQIQYEANDPEAVPLLKHLLKLRPADPTAHAMLAVLEFRRHNCTEAVRHFEAAGPVLETQLDAQNAYGTCLVRLRRFDEATKVFGRALALNPDNSRQRQLVAAIQLMAHRPQEAIATLQPLMAAGRADAHALELASSAYEDAGDTPAAVSALRQAILLDPRNPNFYIDFANLSLNHQSFQVGISVVSDGISVQPKTASLYLARGVLYVQLADYEKAEADFETAHQLDPGQSLSSAAQGLVAAQQNDLDRALATVQTKLARKPDDAYLLYLRADFLTQKGAEPNTPEFRTAMQSARKAVALQPALGDARVVLAKLYMQVGQYQDAAAECRKALEINPKDQTAVYRLIQALRKTDDKKELPDLLKRLADLRKQAAKEEGERNRYRLVEGDSEPGKTAQP